jgi:hypothetical protein
MASSVEHRDMERAEMIDNQELLYAHQLARFGILHPPNLVPTRVSHHLGWTKAWVSDPFPAAQHAKINFLVHVGR